MPTLGRESGLATVLIFAFLLPGSAGAQDEAFSRLMTAQTISCDFNASIIAEWPRDRLSIEEGAGFENPLIFDNIDPEQGTARMIGNLGGADIVVIPTPSGLSFIESSVTGNLLLTTIFPTRRADGEFFAVHSRHVLLISDPLPSQAYGTCKVLL